MTSAGAGADVARKQVVLVLAAVPALLSPPPLRSPIWVEHGRARPLQSRKHAGPAATGAQRAVGQRYCSVGETRASVCGCSIWTGIPMERPVVADDPLGSEWLALAAETAYGPRASDGLSTFSGRYVPAAGAGLESNHACPHGRGQSPSGNGCPAASAGVGYQLQQAECRVTIPLA